MLLGLVEDFPLASDMHKVRVARRGFSTPLARPAVDGPAPLFLLDANLRGAGKGLLVELIARIVSGSPFPVLSYPSNAQDSEAEVEENNLLTVVRRPLRPVRQCHRCSRGRNPRRRRAHGPGVEGPPPRRQQAAPRPLDITFYATANNISLRPDTSRRVCCIRLESPLERPEERADLKRPHLLREVTQNREPLLAHALDHPSGLPRRGLPGLQAEAVGFVRGVVGPGEECCGLV